MPQSPSTEEDKTKEVKRRLKIRGIPEDDWQYYIESPHSWDYSKVASSGLSKGVEVVLLSPTMCAVRTQLGRKRIHKPLHST